MRSEVHQSFREGSQHFAEAAAPRERRAADRTPIGTPASLWLETADSVFKWYGAMLRLALGLGRIDDRGEVQGLIAPPAPVKPEESSRNGSGEAPSLSASPALTPEPSPAEVAALHSVPTVSAKLRPKRRKTASRGKTGARSSKMSSVKRSHRRAA